MTLFTQAILLTQLVYFTNTHCNQSALHCMKLLKHTMVFSNLYCIFLVQLKSVTYQSIDSFYYAFFILVVTQFVWILERMFTPVQEPSVPCVDPPLFVVIASVQD